MTQYLHVVMSLGGDEYSPELSDDQLTDMAVVAKDIVDGEFLGEFVRAGSVNYGTGHFLNHTQEIWDLIEANKRAGR